MPLSAINKWQECDLQRYAAYFAKHGTPQSRLEYMLAQIAWVAATVAGGKMGIDDFLLKTDKKPAQLSPKPQPRKKFNYGLTGALVRPKRKRR